MVWLRVVCLFVCCLCSALHGALAVPLAKPLHLLGDGLGTPAPASFDCKTRHLAMEFAIKKQPFRSSSSFKILADDLNAPGGLPGGETQCHNVTYPGPEQDFNPLFPVDESSPFALFVDFQNGQDTNQGTLPSPIKTIHHALKIVRASRQNAHHTTASPASTPAWTIVLREGVHFISEVINITRNITHDDSNISFQNYNGEQVWISGAVALQGIWTPFAYKNRPNIFSLDLTNIPNLQMPITGLRRNRQRAFRARYPNGCFSNETSSGYACVGETGNPLEGFGSSLLTDWVFPPSPTMDTPSEEYNPDTPMRTSGSSFQTYQIGIGGGQCEYFSPPAGYWCGNKCSGGAPAPPDCIVRWPLGLLHNSSVLPNAPYASLTGAVVQAWHPGHWASWMFGVDAEHSNATHMMFLNPGFQGARGAYPDKMADTFFVENVLEELDFENEFYHDVANKRLLYVATNGTTSGELDTDVFEATQIKNFVSVVGSIAMPVRNVAFRGVGFRDSALSYLDAHAMPSGGDWALGRVAAVFVYGAENTVIDSCTFEKLDGNALLVNGYARDTMIVNNDFHEIGDNVIGLLGETSGAPAQAWGMGPNGTIETQPRFTTIASNFAYRCGLFEKQSSFYFQAKSCQNEISDNIFFHGPRAAINFNDGFGGGSQVTGNLLFSAVMESGDHGPFNSWDRQVFITNVRDGTPSPEKAYDEIRNNFFLGNYYSQEDVDNDDGSAFYETHGNFLVYGDIGMKNDYNGHDNHHHNNIYAYVGQGLGIGGALPGHVDKFYSNKVIQTSSTAYADYDCSCVGTGSNPTDTCPFFQNNMIYTPDGSMGNICGKSIEQWQQEGRDLGSAVLEWPDDDTVITWAREVLGLPESKQPAPTHHTSVSSVHNALIPESSL